MQTPNFLVVGAGRSGTTAVVEGLRAHPDVFVTRPKEPHYFAFHGQSVDFRGPGDDQWVNRVSVTNRDDYLALYADAGDHLARGDGSVTTLYYSQHAASEIARMNPRTRLVVLLREPVDRAYSSWAYLRARGVEPEQQFSRAVALEQSRREAHWQHMWHYLAMSHYSADVSRLIDTVGRKNVGVWFYDDLLADYSAVMSQIAGFLDLPPYPSGPPSMPTVNSSGTPRSRAAQSVITWATNNEAVRAGLKSVIGFRTRERIRSATLRRDVVDSATAADLRAVFADDLRRLATVLPDPLPSWLRSV